MPSSNRQASLSLTTTDESVEAMRFENQRESARRIATMLLTNLVVVLGTPLLSVAQQGEAENVSPAAVRTFNKLDKNDNGILEPGEWDALRGMRQWVFARGYKELPTVTLDNFTKLYRKYLRDLLRKHQQQISKSSNKAFTHEGGEFVGSFQSRGPMKTPRDKPLPQPAVVLGNDNRKLSDNRQDVVHGGHRLNPSGIKFIRAAEPDENAKNWSRNELTLFAELDRNFDGFVTAEEISESSRLKNAASRKSRPSLSKQKKAASKKHGSELPTRYRSRDKNGDGQIALYEWLGVTPVSGVEIFQQYPRVADLSDGFLGTSRRQSTGKVQRKNHARSQLSKPDGKRKPNSSRKHLFRRYRKPSDPSSR